MDYATCPSPVGELTIFANEAGITGIYFPGHKRGRLPGVADRRVAPPTGVLAEAVGQLGEYFTGDRRVFDLPLDPQGTEFQRAVWRELAAIPFGGTTTYGRLAADLGRVPGASRAVGSAVGRNPISIVVPCHRVVGASGALTGFAGGIEAKTWLLDHERDAASDPVEAWRPAQRLGR